MIPGLTLLILLIALNLYVGSRIRLNGETRVQQNMVIAMLWIAPFVGLLFALGHTKPAQSQPLPAEPLLPGTVAGPAPLQLSFAGLPPLALAPHMQTSNGYPFFRWQALEEWTAALPDPQRAVLASQVIKRAWLSHLRDAFGSTVRLHEADDAFVLSPLANNVVLATAAYVTTTRARIDKLLAGLAQFPEHDKSVLVVAPDETDYYHYVSTYYPDGGHFANSGGMFINHGCPHFVVALNDLANIEPVIAHELTHSALAHLHLPRWLDEGLAVNTEMRLTRGGGTGYTQHQLHAMHLAFWGPQEMQEFWSGASFFRPDNGNLLSYELARVLVAHMGSDWTRFSSFARAAERSDGGAQAAQDIFGVSLGTLVCALLEQEYDAAWEPAVQ